jgi:hypothetical protein
MGDSYKGLFSEALVNAADLEADLSGSDSGHPEFRLAFAFAHSSFKRLGAYRLMRKYPDIDFALTMQKMSSRDSASLNVLCGDPTGLEGLQDVFAESHIIASRGVAFHFASLALAILDSFRHHRHFSFPSQNQIHQGSFPGQKANLSSFQPCQPGRAPGCDVTGAGSVLGAVLLRLSLAAGTDLSLSASPGEPPCLGGRRRRRTCCSISSPNLPL